MAASPSYDDLLRENDALREKLAEREAQAEQSRQTEERVRVSEERLRRAADSAGAIVYDFDLRPGGRFILQGMERLTGLAPEDIQFTLDWWTSRIHPEDVPAYLAALQRQLRAGGVMKSAFRILHASGEWLHVESSREVILDGDGDAVRLVGVLVNISQRAMAESAVRESEARYRALADTMPQIVFTATAAGLVDYVNRPGLGYMGVAIDDAMCLGWLATIHPDDRYQSADRWLDCIKSGTPYEFEHRLLRADGTYRWQLARAIPITNERGGIVRWIGTSTDIHDRRQAELALLESRAEAERQAEELDGLYQTSPAGLAFLDRELRFVRINRTLADINGLPVEAHIGRTVGEVFPADLAERLTHILRRTMDSGQPAMNVELQGETSAQQGSVRYWLANYYPLKDPEGEVLGVNVVVQDITERKRVEESRRKSHAFIRHIIDTDPNFVFTKDREGRFTLVNRAVAECYGTTVEGLVGKTEADFNFNAEEVAHFQRKDREVIDGLEDLFIAEEAVTDASGAVRWLQTVKRPLFDEHGRATQVLGVSTDITQRKAAEQALRKSEERLKAIMDRAPAAIFIKDRNGRHLFVNTECAAVLGMERDDAIGKMDSELFPAALADQFRTNDAQIWESGQARLLEERIPRPDGVRTYLSQKFLLRDVDGMPYALCGIATDITERKRAEERQRFMARLAERIRLAVDAEALLGGVVESVGRFLGAAHCSMAENDAAMQRARLRASWSRLPSEMPLPQEFAVADYGSLARELNSGRAFRCHDAQADERTAAVYDLAYRPFGTRGFLCVPLLRHGVWVATFSVAFGESYDWTDEKTSMLEAVAERAWNAVEKFRAERALRESEERLRLALAGGKMGAWDVDLATDETRWDAEEYALLGFTDRSVTPSTAEFYRRVHPEDLPFVQRSVQRAVEETGALEHEFRILTGDGEVRWLAAKGQVVKDDHGRPVRMVGVNFDVTERKRTEERLRSFTLELETRVAERTSELVQSHGRLRALATDLNLTEQRERARLATDLHDYLAQLLALVRMRLGHIKRLAPGPDQAAAVREAENVVNEALTYTRTLVTQLSPPVLRNFGLPPALKWLGEQMVRQELSIEVRQLVPDQLPLPEDEAVLLFQSVRELLMNVRKHAKTHRAVVTLEQIDDALCLSVRDEGAGMDLTTVAAPETPSATSSKFGLFSIRERMLAIGGRFEVDSQPGRGMTATLTVPLSDVRGKASGVRGRNLQELEVTETRGGLSIDHQPSSVESASDVTSRLTPDASRIRVLLVDDHAMVRQGLKDLLRERPGTQIVGEAWDGEEAIAFVDKLRPHVVIMDVNMPKIDGIEATRRIKAAFKNVTIVGLSVNSSPEVAEAMRAAGADEFLSKDAPSDTIYHTILRYRPSKSEC